MNGAAWIAIPMLLYAGAAEAAARSPDAERIAHAVEQLGADAYAAREQAMQTLAEFGDEALEAVVAARQHADAEVRYRAAIVERQISLGIGPQTPRKVVEQLERYHAGDRTARLQVISWLEGAEQFDALQRLHRREGDEHLRGQLRDAIARHTHTLLPPLILADRWSEVEKFLLTFPSSDPGEQAWARVRFYWATGRIEQGIEQLQQQGTDPNHHAPLAALYALQQKWPEALAADGKSGTGGLTATYLVAAANWHRLAVAAPISAGNTEMANIKRFSSQALFFEMAGDQAAAEQAFNALRALRTEDMSPAQRRRWSTRLLLLDRFDEAAEHLATDDPLLLASLRLRRREFEQLARWLRWDAQPAFDGAWLNSLPTKADDAPATQFKLALLCVRALAHCGRPADARRVLDTLDRNPLPGENRQAHLAALAQAALEADDWERFLDYAVEGTHPLENNEFWNAVAPQQAETAKLWQTYFEQAGKSEPPGDFVSQARLRLTQITQLSGIRQAPRLATEDLERLLQAAENNLEQLPPETQAPRRKLIAETSLKHGRHERAERLLELLADTDPSAAMLLGDFVASRSPQEAATWYRRAWDTGRKLALRAVQQGAGDKSGPGRAPAEQQAAARVAQNRSALLALYLAGVHKGNEEGNKFKRAALALLPNPAEALAVAQQLQQRGLRDDARRLAQLVRCVSPLGSAGHAQSVSLLASVGDESPAAAAQGWQQARATALLTGATFSMAEGYCDLPRNLYLAEARSAMTEQRWDELPHLLAKLNEASPGDLTAYEAIYPLLKENERTAEAQALFEQHYQRHRRFHEQFPESAAGMNGLAWLCAMSGQRLDEALSLAQEAVKRKPQQAAYLDTLAEVHFQRGDRPQAVEWARQAAELAPRHAEIQRRLKRFRSDPLPE
jgi:hypothetical protein